MTAGRARRVELGYLPGIDGVRALAIATVVAYHAGLPGAHGGFLGVDVFFAISGYLISNLLIAEWRSNGRIALGAFWVRRARRLLPAVTLLLAVAGVLLLTVEREQAVAQRGDVLAALGYVSNWYQIAADRSYFEAFGRPPLLRHLWSLAVEEQFYVVWPLVVAGLLAVTRRKRVMVGALAVAAVGSAALMWVLYGRWVAGVPGADASSVYLRTDTRAVGLLAGGAAAFWFHTPLTRRTGRRWAGGRVIGAVTGSDLLGVVSVAVLLAIVLAADTGSAWLYRGGFAVVGVSTALLLIAVTHPDRWLWRRERLVGSRPVGGFAPLRWAGERSYGLYLWHWPVFIYTRPGRDITGAPEWLVQIGRIVSALIIAELSFRLVEQPFRRGAWRRWGVRVRRSTVPAGAVAASALTLALVNAAPVTTALERNLAENEALLAAGAMLPPVVPSPPPTTSTGATGSTVPSGSPVPTDGRSAAPVAVAAGRPVGMGPVPAAPGPTLPWGPLDVPGLAVGDSVQLGAAAGLQGRLGRRIRIDARTARSFLDGLKRAEKAIADGSVGDVLIIHLGNNGVVSERRWETFLERAAGVPLVVLVTVEVPDRPWVDDVNTLIWRTLGRYPNVAVADWRRVALDHPEALYRDRTHVRAEQALLYGDVVGIAVARACDLPPRRRPSATSTTTTTLATSTTAATATTATATTATATSPDTTSPATTVATTTSPATTVATTTSPATTVATTTSPDTTSPATAAPDDPATAAARTTATAAATLPPTRCLRLPVPVG